MPSCSDLGNRAVGVDAPRGQQALPHNEGTAHKPACSEVAVRRRVGRMGPTKRRRKQWRHSKPGSRLDFT